MRPLAHAAQRPLRLQVLVRRSGRLGAGVAHTGGVAEGERREWLAELLDQAAGRHRWWALGMSWGQARRATGRDVKSSRGYPHLPIVKVVLRCTECRASTAVRLLFVCISTTLTTVLLTTCGTPMPLTEVLCESRLTLVIIFLSEEGYLRFAQAEAQRWWLVL